jgi:hypothetical protein
MRLAAGLQIDFSSSMSMGGGLGVELGATSGLSTSEPAARPSPTRPSSPVPAQAPAEGTALTAQGGLSRALDRAAASTAGAAAASTVAAFPLGPDPAPAAAAAVTPNVPSPYTAGAAASETADPRALSYGFGVPLRPRLGVARATTVGVVHERTTTVTAPADDGVPHTDDPTVPPWLALPDGVLPASPGSGRDCGCGCRGLRRSSGCGCAPALRGAGGAR